ncbi:hypothetical protein REPUB_Repub17cG0131400 [Reevesia pubescens]
MTEEQAPESIPPRMTGPMCDRDNFLELVWENGQVLIRGLSSKLTKESFPCSSDYSSQSSKTRNIQREGETSTKNRSNNGIADSTFGDPLSGLTKLNRHDKNKINSLQTGYPEQLSSELYEDGFNVVSDSDKKCNNKQLIDSNIGPVNKFKSFKQSYVSKLVEEIDPQQTLNSNSEVPQSSLKQYEASIQYMRSKEKKSRIDDKTNRMNFSIFLRSVPALVKSNHPSCGATRSPTNSPALAVGSEDLEGNARSGPRSNNPFEKEGNFMARNMKPIILNDSEPQKESLPDEQSEAVGHKDIPPNTTRFPAKVHGGPSSSLAPNSAKGNPGSRKSVEQMVASSSICSRGASNCPTYTLKRRYHEDTDLRENHAMEEPKGTTKAAPARGGRKGAKRKRKAEVHNLSERRRRDKINKKMRALQELIPNCIKVDKVSMLDEAIEYLKTLQLQVQMMSMGTGVYMPPNPMMLPSAMQHINAQHLGVGMGMRMQMGLGCGLAAQFPTSLMPGSAATLPGITEARLNMLGFPGQVSLMSMSRSPFASLGGRFSPQSVQAPGAGPSQSAPAAQVELPVAACCSQSTSKDSNPTH